MQICIIECAEHEFDVRITIWNEFKMEKKILTIFGSMCAILSHQNRPGSKNPCKLQICLIRQIEAFFLNFSPKGDHSNPSPVRIRNESFLCAKMQRLMKMFRNAGFPRRASCMSKSEESAAHYCRLFKNHDSNAIPY